MAALTPILMVKPTLMAIQNWKAKAIERLLAPPEKEAAAMLPATVNALRNAGYHVDLKTTTQAAQKKIFLNRQKIEFDFEQKMLHPDSEALRKKFDPTTVIYPRVLMDADLEHTPFFYGWTVVLQSAVAMFKSGLVRKVSAADGAHANADQIQIGCVAKDANNQIITIGVGRYANTENTETASRLDKAILDQIPITNDASFTTVRDAQKGSIASVCKVTPNAIFFFDTKHSKENARAATNATQAGVFGAWANANTAADASAQHANFSDKLQLWVNNRLKQMRNAKLKCAMTKLQGSKEMAGDTTSSFIESFNKMTVNPRLAGGAQSLSIMMKEEAVRYNKIRQNAIE